jgi:hypothetical protein
MADGERFAPAASGSSEVDLAVRRRSPSGAAHTLRREHCLLEKLLHHLHPPPLGELTQELELLAGWKLHLRRERK